MDVKRLQKRPAPPRFGRKLTEAQKVSLDTIICCYASVFYEFHFLHHLKFLYKWNASSFRLEQLISVSTVGTYTP